MFGKYRDLYYNEGGLIGIPYSGDLKVILEESRRYRDVLSMTLWRSGDYKFRISFFRTWLIKKEMNVLLWLSEILLTWVVIAFCESHRKKRLWMTYLWPAISSNDGQILDIAGGVSLMFAEFILCFWYGFTRYPAGGKEFLEWLYPSQDSDEQNLMRNEQDMEDIRDVCSQYVHDDKEDRFSPVIVWLCFPVVMVEQAVASLSLGTARAMFCCCRNDKETQTYGRHLSRSIAGLIVVMGYYLLWMYGNVYCKLAGTACLLLSQNLYNAVFFKKSLSEFLQSFVFGNMLMFSWQKQEKRLKVRCVSTDEAAGAIPRVVQSDSSSSDSGNSGAKKDLDVTSEMSDDEENNGGMAVSMPPQSTPRVSTMPVMSAPPIFVKESSFRSPPSKSRSLSSFNPLAMLKSATFPKRQRTNSSTPHTLEEDDNVSLDLSYIDRGQIETFVGTAEENRDRSGSLNAAEILEDLATEESGSYKGEEPEPSQVLSVYKATKRRLEEAFYSSTRIHVEDGLDTSGNNENTDDRMPERLQSQASYDFTLTREESELQKKGIDYLPPILRVFDDTKDQEDAINRDVELGNDGKVLGDVSEIEPPQTNPKAKSSSNRSWSFRKRGFFGGSEEKKDEHGEKEIPPPLKQITTDDRTATFDEELTRTGTWEDSITAPHHERSRRYRPRLIEEDIDDDFEGDLCCAEDFLP
ncbi:MAG: hypothetical protein SGILL_007608 [Bacillariaceae sp.]